MKKQYDYNLIIGAVLTVTMLFLILLGCFYTPYDPDAMDSAAKFAGVSLKHLMGCDQFGRDIFSRVLVGLGTTFYVAFGTVCIGTFAGIILGAVTGFFGGVVDEILMRITDALFAIPSILLALVVISLFGSGAWQVMLSLGIAFVPSFARIVRGEFLRLKDMDYVQSARLAGAGKMRIMFVHILPNMRAVLLSTIMIGFNNAVLAEAGLSFLGIGVQPPQSSLGRMLSEAQGYIFSAPGCALFPGIVLVLFVLGFVLLAEAFQERKTV
ncbi:MAG: ABC transporter permease [Lachnospiraceae bacterium]|nr:ABC transporter permease [Lachnospiraceae bacterium]